MNLIEDIEKFFALTDNFDDLTKIRYIYLYVCKVFSYDTRFYSNEPTIKEEIYNTPIDVRNVQNFENVCYAISGALVDILNHFGFDAKKVQEESDTFAHTYAVVTCMNNNEEYHLKLDPTLKHDVTRVKLDSPTLGFTDLDEHHDFTDSVAFSDKVIKTYLGEVNHEEHYDTITIKELNALIQESAKNRNLTDKEFFFEKLEYIMCLVNIRKDLVRYDDIDYYYSYLIRNFEMNEANTIPYLKPAVFYRGEKFEDIIWLTMVTYPHTEPEMLLLNKENDEYKIGKISKKKAQELLDNYENYDCHYFFETYVENMPDDEFKTL